MKKVVLVVLLVVSSLSYVNAQDVTYGVKVGANFSNFNGDSMDTDMITRMHAAVTGDIALSDSFSLQPELMYSAEGVKAKTGGFENKLNYLRIPLMLKYYVSSGFSIDAGPQVGFLVSAEDQDGTDIKDGMESIDFGFNIGSTYLLDSGVNISVRYNIGITDVVDGSDAKNGVFQLSLGYVFQ
ncbi:porin family protein [Bacteroidota bacterium]